MEINTIQAAQYYGVTPKTLARWRSQDKGPRWHKTDGGRIRYYLSDVMADAVSERLWENVGYSGYLSKVAWFLNGIVPFEITFMSHGPDYPKAEAGWREMIEFISLAAEEMSNIEAYMSAIELEIEPDEGDAMRFDKFDWLLENS